MDTAEESDDSSLPRRVGAQIERDRYYRNQASQRRAPLTPNLELREIRKGTKPGSRYVRLAPRREQPFRRVAEGEYQATEVATRPRTPTERLWRGVKRVVVGPPLATSQLFEERLSKVKALAIFASDNLSSSAYATEEILLILLLAGSAAFTWSIPIACAIVALVVIVVISYRQIIHAYPNGGGAYVVTRENLGLLLGLVAGASLVVDYTLTAAVSTAAGVAAVTSAVPELFDFRIHLAVGFILLLTLANLRGVRESGTIFALPTYFFLVSFAALIVTGLVRLALGHDLTAATPSHPIETGAQTIGLFLILRAFSSGSAALTGIEAVSNGVPSFKPPGSRNASTVLLWMAAILSFFFLGETVLAYQIDVTPAETKTVVAQVTQAVFGSSPLFFIVQIATMLILVLAANTSFAGFPRLASVMARDRVVPHQFSFKGDRLAFSNGIILVGLASAALLIVYQARTHSLIPLYAVGVFVGFTLSQTGLVLHWRRSASPGARRSFIINAFGAAATGVVAVVIAVTKFVDGAWITLIAIALLTFVFRRIHLHYRHVQEQLRITTAPAPSPTPPPSPRTPSDPYRSRAVVVPVDELNKATLRALAFARSISDNVSAVHVTDELEEGERLRERWENLAPDTPIVIVESPYRSIIAPILAYIDAIDRADPEAYITVVLPQFVPAHAWEGLLHNQSSIRLKRALRHRPNTVLIDVPYHLQP